MNAYRGMSGRAVIGAVLALGSLMLVAGSGALSDEAAYARLCLRDIKSTFMLSTLSI